MRSLTSKPTRVLAAMTAALLAACATVGPDPVDPNQRRVEDGLLQAVAFEDENGTFSLAERLAYYRVPGLSFALIDDGEIAWAAGYGVTEAGASRPVEPRTLFQAASIAKPLTATAAMRLRDAGLIDLDADIQRYLERYTIPPGAQTPDNPVTFRNLLSHTAGVTPGGYVGYEPGAPVPDDVQVVLGLPPATSPEVRVVAAPGSRVRYSGGGYTIAEIAMQDVTGLPFDRLMDEWLLSVAGMPRSTFAQPLPTARADEAASGHLADGSVVAGGWRVHPEQAAAGLWSTAPELATFALAVRDAYLGDGDLLAPDSAAKLLTPVIGRDATGFVVQGDGDTLAMSHAGGNVGYRAFMVLYLASGDGAVFMTNGDQGMAVGRELLRAASAVYDWPGFKPVRARRVALPKAALAAFEGTYDFGDGVRAVIALAPATGRLEITFPNGDVYPLVPTGPDTFVHPDTGVALEFAGTDARRTLILYGDTGVRIDD